MSVTSAIGRSLAGLCETLEAARSYVGATSGWRRRAVAFAAGALSVLSMAPFFLWPVLFLTFPVLVWLLDSGGKSRNADATVTMRMRAAAVDGWWFGFGYFLFSLFWIGEAFLVEAEIFGWLMPFAVTIMPAGLALFTALATALARGLWPAGFPRILVLAAVIAIVEWIRGHIFTGFPWNVFGYAFTHPLSLMQSASLIGVYGLTLWVVLVCATPVVVLADAPRKPHARHRALLTIAAVSLAPLLAMYAFGLARLANTPTAYVEDVMLRLVQPSIPQRDKWLGEKQSGIFNDHVALSKTNARGHVDDLLGITHVIWPEASMPFLPLKYPVALETIGEMLPNGTRLIAGALRVENAKTGSAEIPYDDPNPKTGSTQSAPDAKQPAAEPAPPKVFNSLMVFGDDGNLEVIYDKTHLVPFGEYLPFRNVLEAIGLRSLTRLRGGFDTGPTPRQLTQIAGLSSVGVLICYEVIFPGAVVQSKQRPALLLNLTNDGWFGNTTGPRQHFHNSRVRAVEEGLPLIRSANNGISAVIDPQGRVLKRLDLNVRGAIDSQLPKSNRKTTYATWNDAVFALNVLIFLVCTGFLARPRLRA